MTAIHVPVANGQTVPVREPRATASAAVADSIVATHSPLPWRTETLLGDQYTAVWDAWKDGRCYQIARVFNDWPRSGDMNAEFIVRACNNHYSLWWAMLAGRVALQSLTEGRIEEARERAHDALRRIDKAIVRAEAR